MNSKLRKTGLSKVGEAPWGTHFCNFYQTKEDLLEIFVPFIKTGLENNELCVVIGSEPLNEAAALKAFRQAIPDFDRYLNRGQIEIVPFTELLGGSEEFDPKKPAEFINSRLILAREKGFDGLRMANNVSWFKKGELKKILKAGEKINEALESMNLLLNCAFPIKKCEATDLIEVINTHQFTLLKDGGTWKVIEAGETSWAGKVLEDMQEHAHLLTDVLEHTLQPFCAYYPNGRIMTCNASFSEITGYTDDDLRKMTWTLDLTPPEWREKESEALSILQKSKRPQLYEKEIIRKDGTFLPVELYVHQVNDIKGKTQYYWSFLADITARKQSENILMESEKKYRLLYSNMPVGIVVTDFEGNILDINCVALNMSGYDREDAKNLNITSVYFNPADRRTFLKKLQKNGRVHEWEARFRKKDGGIFYALINAEQTEIGGKKVILSTMRDITKHKRAEEALRQSHKKLENNVRERTEELQKANELLKAEIAERQRVEESLSASERLYRTLSEAAHDFIFVIGRGNYLEYVNTFAANLLLKNPAELTGRKLDEFFPAGISARFKKNIQKVFKYHEAIYVEGEVPYPGGKTLWLGTWLVPIKARGENKVSAVLGVSRDITENKRTEEAFIESENKLRQTAMQLQITMDNAPGGIATSDLNYRFTYANKVFCSFFGYTKEEMLKMSFKDITHPDDMKISLKKMNELAKGKAKNFKIKKRYIRKDGTAVTARVSLAVIRDSAGALLKYIAQLEMPSGRKTTSS